MKNLILFLIIVIITSCSEKSGNRKVSLYKNKGTTFWMVNGEFEEGKIIALIDSTFIINVIECKNSDEIIEATNSKYSFLIESFIKHQNNNKFITDLNNNMIIELVLVDTSNILLKYEIGGEKDILKLSKINYDLNYTEAFLKTWFEHLHSYENDTLVHYSGQEYGLQIEFKNKGSIVYESVALILDTADVLIDEYLGPDLIIMDLNSNELYQIPNFFKNNNHFFPILYRDTHIESDILRSNKYIEIIKEDIKHKI